MKTAVLFDLGNTLAAYYHPEAFRPILATAIQSVLDELRSRNLTKVPFDTAMQTAISENAEAPDFRFTPMEERFERIFAVSLKDQSDFAFELCRTFLRPIFDVGRIYDDTFSALDALRRAGHPVAIVSNAPWGSPPELWQQELARLGLASAVDSVVMCGDVGWRKPAAQIFRHAAAALGRPTEACVFVGDDLRWDVSGSQAVGMIPVLIDRDRRNLSYDGQRIEDLHGVLRIVESIA